MTGGITNALIRQEQLRRTLTVLGVVIVAIGGVAIVVFANRESRLTRMSQLASRVALDEQTPEAVNEIDRTGSPEIYYHVVLGDVPLGWTLQLRCEWQDPSGHTAFYNQYATRIVYKSMWPTHCRQRFRPTAPAGEWHVRMLIGGRVLSSSAFVLK
jgi:hypothetical protein